jgi:NitT/TauT family transport system permease protein
MATFQEKSVQPERSLPVHSSASTKTRKHQRRQTLLINGGRLLCLICFLGLWQFASGRYLSELFFSNPVEIFKQTYAWIIDGTLWTNTSITLEETLLGLFFGSASGILLGFLIGQLDVIGKIIDPFLIAVNSIPKVALAPVFIMWFGTDLSMKVILATMTVFFLVFLNTLAGVRNVDQDLVDAVRLMGGKKRDILFKVMVPSASSYVLVGLHIAIPYALIGAVIGELVATNHGLGYLINDSASGFNTAGVFSSLLVLTVIAAILNAAVDLIDRTTSRWKPNMRLNNRVIP